MIESFSIMRRQTLIKCPHDQCTEELPVLNVGQFEAQRDSVLNFKIISLNHTATALIQLMCVFSGVCVHLSSVNKVVVSII